jgi:uncharacterized damage-inducible protein DinB
MSEPLNIQLANNPVDECDLEIGRSLWEIEDTRRRTLASLKDIDESLLDWQAPHADHTIGTLLYHVAAIEISWLGIDVMEGKLPKSVWDAFPYEVRDEQGRLTSVKGLPLSAHYERLETVRNLLLDSFKAMPIEDFRRPRQTPEYSVTPEWVLHHLGQHEAEHRGEITMIRTLGEKSLGLR